MSPKNKSTTADRFPMWPALAASASVGQRCQVGSDSAQRSPPAAAAPFHLRPCEVLVSVVHGLELAAIDGNARRRNATMRPQKPNTTVKGDLFRAALEQLINMKHELVQLAADVIVDQVFDRLLRKLGSFRNKQECTVGSGAAFGGYVGLQETSLSCRRGEACQMPTQTRWLCWERISATNLHPFRLIRQAVVG